MFFFITLWTYKTYLPGLWNKQLFIRVWICWGRTWALGGGWRWIKQTWQNLTPIDISKSSQGTCYTDYDCVSPGFHICIENCTDRFSYLRIGFGTFCHSFPVFGLKSIFDKNISWWLSLINIFPETYLFQNMVPHARFPKQHWEPGDQISSSWPKTS